jgi:hypothetical protein
MADIIMPALGMAQDTGKLVQWLKAPGDPVAKGDMLFEVETDKSVMEVEAQADGFLTHVSAANGDDVPVGQVIAVISATADNAVAAPKATPEPASEAAPAPTPAPAAPVAVALNAVTVGRVLSSPKARRLAAEEGLDLGLLAAAGAPMPYHVSDLATLRQMPQRAASAQTVVMATTKQITARCRQQGSRDFIDWMQTDGAIAVTPTAMFTSFAAGAFRAATEAATLVVHVSHPEGDDTYLRNPDFTRLSVPPQETDEDATFILHDLSGSFLTSLRLGDTGVPTLSIGADGDSYVITFEFGNNHMEDAQAIAFISGLARRLADPLHHLV